VATREELVFFFFLRLVLASSFLAAKRAWASAADISMAVAAAPLLDGWDFTGDSPVSKGRT